MQWRLNLLTVVAKGIIMAMIVLGGASIVRNVTAALQAVTLHAVDVARASPAHGGTGLWDRYRPPAVKPATEVRGFSQALTVTDAWPARGRP